MIEGAWDRPEVIHKLKKQTDIWNSRVLVRISSAQSVNDSSETVLNLTSVNYDGLSEWNTGTKRFEPVITSNETRYYHVHCQARVVSLATDKKFYVSGFKNTTRIAYYEILTGALGSPCANIIFDVSMVTDDYLEFVVWHNHGSARNIHEVIYATYCNIHRFA